jgi:hypothetical protein
VRNCCYKSWADNSLIAIWQAVFDVSKTILHSKINQISMQVLAIDKVSEGVTEKMLLPHLPSELAATVGLYLKEKIRTFYFRKDRPGVVFLLETESLDEAKEILGTLPLVKENLLDFDLIPIGPLAPLGMLFPKTES